MAVAHKVRVALRRAVVLGASAVAPKKSLRLERYLRGQEDFTMLRQSDVAVVSFGKSGRTWLRVLLSHYYQQRYKLPADKLITHDNLHVLNRKVPRIFFTHDNYLGDFTGTHESKEPYRQQKVVLLVRHPMDTAVSQFFQWKHRMRPRKMFINAYPQGDGDMQVLEFVRGGEAGIPKIIRFMNGWAKAIGGLENILVVRYETLKSDTAGTLGRVLAFMGETATKEELDACVSFASIENMRAMEQDQFYKRAGNRMKPGDASNPDSFKVRRAKVGGYRDYFSEDEAAALDATVRAELNPFFGYSGKPADAGVL